uniref:Uncharacterized protein n=1 Tax=Methanosarcina mazei TaxID=2209 RepID=O33155_METMZ|nr:hypothetical protein [Methanosarcina mazei]
MAAFEKAYKRSFALHNYAYGSSIGVLKSGACDDLGNSLPDPERREVNIMILFFKPLAIRQEPDQNLRPPRRAIKSAAIMISAVEPGLILLSRSSESNSCILGRIEAKSPAFFPEISQPERTSPALEET